MPDPLLVLDALLALDRVLERVLPVVVFLDFALMFSASYNIDKEYSCCSNFFHFFFVWVTFLRKKGKKKRRKKCFFLFDFLILVLVVLCEEIKY